MEKIFPKLRAFLTFMSRLPVPSPFQNAVFFGPKALSGNNGKSAKTKHKFNAGGHFAPFVLHVRNGRQNGELMLGGGELWLNDQMVLGPSDFSQAFDNREIKVELNEMNKLEIRPVDSSTPFEVTVWVEGLRLAASI
jgi:hypothetical protein